MNKTIIKGGAGYEPPVCASLELSSEGILCESNPAGAGVLNDNEWNLTFGEN